MANILRKIPFREELLPAVQAFACGDSEWEKPLAQWLKADPGVENGALNRMTKRDKRLQVWLRVNEQDELVGFSALGESRWEWPARTDPRVPLMLIPNVAIQTRFQSQPKDGPRYSTQIFDHLVFEARQYIAEHGDRRTIYPLLGLFVDPRNDKAKKAYARASFKPFWRVNNDEGITYESWLLKLEEYQPSPPPTPAA